MTSAIRSTLPPPPAQARQQTTAFLQPIQPILNDLKNLFGDNLADIEICGPNVLWFLGATWTEKIHGKTLNGETDYRFTHKPHHVTIRFRFLRDDDLPLRQAQTYFFERHIPLTKRKLLNEGPEHWSLLGIEGFDFYFILRSEHLLGPASCDSLSFSILYDKPVEGSSTCIQDIAEHVWRDHPGLACDINYPLQLSLQLIRGYHPTKFFNRDWLQPYEFNLRRLEQFQKEYLDSEDEKFLFIFQLAILLSHAGRQEEANQLYQAFQLPSQMDILAASFGLAAWRNKRQMGWTLLPYKENSLWIYVDPYQQLETVLQNPPQKVFWSCFSSSPFPLDREGALRFYDQLKKPFSKHERAVFAMGFIPHELIGQADPVSWILTLAQQSKLCDATIALELWRKEPSEHMLPVFFCLAKHHLSLARQMVALPPLDELAWTSILENLEQMKIWPKEIDVLMEAFFDSSCSSLLHDELRKPLLKRLLNYYCAPDKKPYSFLLEIGIATFPEEPIWKKHLLETTNHPSVLFRKWIVECPKTALVIASIASIPSILKWLGEAFCDHRFHFFFKYLMNRIVQEQAWDEEKKCVPLLIDRRMQEHLYLQFLEGLLDFPPLFRAHFLRLETKLSQHRRFPHLVFSAMRRCPNDLFWAEKLLEISTSTTYQRAAKEALGLLPWQQFAKLKQMAQEAVKRQDAQTTRDLLNQVLAHPWAKYGFEPSFLSGCTSLSRQDLASFTLSFLRLTGFSPDYLPLLHRYGCLNSLDQSLWSSILLYLERVQLWPTEGEAVMEAFFASPFSHLLQGDTLLYHLLDHCVPEKIPYWVHVAKERKIHPRESVLFYLAQTLICECPSALSRLDQEISFSGSFLQRLFWIPSSPQVARFFAGRLDRLESWQPLFERCLESKDSKTLNVCKAFLQKKRTEAPSDLYQKWMETFFCAGVSCSTQELVELTQTSTSLKCYTEALQRLLSSTLNKETLHAIWTLFQTRSSVFFALYPSTYLKHHLHFILRIINQLSIYEDIASPRWIFDQLFLVFVLFQSESPYEHQNILIPYQQQTIVFKENKRFWQKNKDLLSKEDWTVLVKLVEKILLNLSIPTDQAFADSLFFFSKVMKALSLSPESLLVWLQKCRSLNHSFIFDFRGQLLKRLLMHPPAWQELDDFVQEMGKEGFTIRLKTLVYLSDEIKTIPTLDRKYSATLENHIRQVIAAMIEKGIGKWKFLKFLITRYSESFSKNRLIANGEMLINICASAITRCESEKVVSTDLLDLVEHLADRVVSAIPNPSPAKTQLKDYPVIAGLIPQLYYLASFLLRHDRLLPRPFFKPGVVQQLLFPYEQLLISTKVCLLIREPNAPGVAKNRLELRQAVEEIMRLCLEANNRASNELLTWVFNLFQPTEIRPSQIEDVLTFIERWKDQHAFFQAHPEIPPQFVASKTERFAAFCKALGLEFTQQFFPTYIVAEKK